MSWQMNSIVAWTSVLIWAIAASGALRTADAETGSAALPEVKSIRVGFGNHYKLGCWAPVEVTLSGAAGDSGATGIIEVQALDGDAVPAWTAPGAMVIWTAGQTCTAYSRIGRAEGPIRVGLKKAHGNEVEILPGVTAAAGVTAIPATNELIVEVGGSLGLMEMFRREEQREIDRTTVVTLTQPEALPEKWYAYEGVDRVAIAGHAGIEKSFFNAAAIDALEHWVRLGGNLVIACGEDAQQVVGDGAPLARFAPGTLSEEVNLPASRFGAIETFAKVEADERLAANRRIRVPVWTNVKGIVELSAGLPLVVRYPMGFGQVTFVGLDLDRPPLAEWAGRTKFLEALLGRRSSATSTAGVSLGGASGAVWLCRFERAVAGCARSIRAR